MRTGTTRKCHRPALLFVALFAVFALVTLTGCDDNSPVAAPTSTVPEPQPSSGSTDDAAEVAIPEYETDLDLTDKEKEAVDGALVAFQGYFHTVNEAYSGNFSAAEDFQKYATGNALESIKGDVAVIKDGSYSFSGTVAPSKLSVDNVEPQDGSDKPSRVTVHFCFDLSKWSLVPKDESQDADDNGLVTMEHHIRKQSGSWKVSEQTLRERKC